MTISAEAMDVGNQAVKLLTWPRGKDSSHVISVEVAR